MDFGFSEEQELLREQFARLLEQESPLPEVRRVVEGASGYAPALWKQMAEMGVTGLLIPERFGGAGLGWVELVVALEESGRALLPSPLLSNTLVAAVLSRFGSEPLQESWLPRLAEGSAVATVALLEEAGDPRPGEIELEGRADGEGFELTGRKCFVPDEAAADVFLVSFRAGAGEGEVGLALVERQAEGVSVEAVPPLDRTKPGGELHLNRVSVPAANLVTAPSAGLEPLGCLADLGALAVSAETIGVMEAILALTTRYAKDRVQFGSPIGRFQGVKHPLAELHVDIECLKSLVYYAAWSLEASPEESPKAIAQAKAWASEAVTRAGVTGIQLHGAVGFTEEYDIQLYLKRSKWARPAFGDETYHYDRVAEMGGI